VKALHWWNKATWLEMKLPRSQSNLRTYQVLVNFFNLNCNLIPKLISIRLRAQNCLRLLRKNNRMIATLMNCPL
jgi:hypothetical protein